MFQDLTGKVALVTGAFSGLGLHFARTLARHGAKVALAGRRIEQGKAIAAQLVQEGRTAIAVSLDVKQQVSAHCAIDEIARELGPISILVNNAGVANTKPFLQMDEADWNAVVDVNLTGAWRVAQAVAKHMAASGPHQAYPAAPARQTRTSRRAAASTRLRCFGIHDRSRHRRGWRTPGKFSIVSSLPIA